MLNETTRILEHSNSKVTRDLECENSNSRTRVLDCRVLITRECKKLAYKFRVICTVHALAQSNRQAAHMNLAANTMGGEHTCCRHTMPAHGSSHHGWRIITDNAGSRQLTPRVEYNSHTMPAHGSSHHGWRIITDNAGSRQLTPRVENNHRQCPLTAAHTTGGG